jgi:signal transduction histidine kinase
MAAELVTAFVRSRRGRVVAAGLIISAIAVVDWRIELDVAFGFLYVFPLILVGTVWPRWGIALVAILCTTLADLFDPYPFIAVSVPHDILVFTALAGTGFFANAVARSQQLAKQAEEQFQFLVETSSAAILTTSDDGAILLANAAAHRLFRALAGSLPGKDIARYLPTLARINSLDRLLVLPSQSGNATIRSEVQCRGERETGEGFLANVFFSTYQTALGPRVAAVIVDVSEALREREIVGLEQLLAGSRILVGAIFHEVRNMSSALALTYEALARSGRLAGNKDFEAHGVLLTTLARLATTQLTRAETDTDAAAVDLVDVVSDLRLVLDPFCEESGITVHWELPSGLPRVWADRHRLLQVLLNLMRNSERALTDQDMKQIDVTASLTDHTVSIRVTDSGPGVSAPDQLFQPFQSGHESTGLGLYLSRALLRSFQGDLRYDPMRPGCSFVIELAVVDAPLNETPADRTDTNGTHPIAVG